MIYTLEGRSLETEGDFFIAETAVVIGAVRLKHEASVWWGAVLRGDYDTITIGRRTNVQDNSGRPHGRGFPRHPGRPGDRRAQGGAPWLHDRQQQPDRHQRGGHERPP